MSWHAITNYSNECLQFIYKYINITVILMYSYIIDPITKTKHPIHSSGGKNILKIYLKQHKNSVEYKSNKIQFTALKSTQSIYDKCNIIFNKKTCKSKSKKHKYDIVVFSADYDGCWDILFGPVGRVLTIKNKNTKSYLDVRNKLVTNIEGFLEKASTHMLMVASARQSIVMDKYNRDIHSNIHSNMGVEYKDCEGYCLKDFTTLCDDNNWTLLRFLYPDISKATYSKVASNILLDIESRKKGDLENNKLVWNNPELFTGKRIISKNEILFSQINILKLLYPKKKILMVFYDDDSSGLMFNSMRNKLKKKKLPSNFTVKLYRFNWFNMLKDNDELTEIKWC